MSDLISRQAAIDAIRALWDGTPTAQHVSAMFDCEDVIQALPSAQPRNGKWLKEMIGATPYKYRCSKCNKYSRAMYDFCPNCGADMRGGEDG